MKKFCTLSFFMLVFAPVFAQTVTDSIQLDPQKQLNAAQRILSGNYGRAVTVGGYGEILYNQPEGKNGELDVQRLVLLVGYKFNEKVQFVTEIEFEHVEEVFVEQAFVNYNVADNFNVRGGLMLVPMGIVNEFHEPTTFNGTERPAVDNTIIPTTWREIGLGVTGRINELSLGYQAYIFNGFKSYDGSKGFLKGSNGLRGGRQKGIQSTINKPNFAAKVDYYGIPGLRLGLSGYFGRTQATDDVDDIEGADIGISMVGLDARYAKGRFTARGQYIYGSLSDTDAYNQLTGTTNDGIFTPNDLGAALEGWYIESAYNLLPVSKEQKLFAFARYEQYNTHADTEGSLVQNDAYNRNDLTLGLTYHLAPGVVAKGDYQIRDNAVSGGNVDNRLNFGLGVWF